MKQFPFIQMVVLATLMVVVASCSTPMGASGDYYEDAPVRGNVYYADPYLGGVNTIIVQRDPYTGQYYQVSPGLYGGGVYAAPAYPYRGYRNYGGGGRRYNNMPHNNYRNYNSGNGQANSGYYRTYPQTQQRQQPQQVPAQRPQMQQQRNEAKDAIFGPKRRN